MIRIICFAYVPGLGFNIIQSLPIGYWLNIFHHVFVQVTSGYHQAGNRWQLDIVRVGEVIPGEMLGVFRHHSSLFNYGLRVDAAFTPPHPNLFKELNSEKETEGGNTDGRL
jgi:hypothetical protein